MSPRAPHEAVLVHALELSRRMLAACRQHDWALLAQLESQRGKLLDQAFAGPTETGNAATVAETIQQLIALDRDILACCEEEKRSCAQQLQQLTRGKHAADAYHDQHAG